MSDEQLSPRSRIAYALAGLAAIALAVAAVAVTASPDEGRVRRYRAVFARAGQGLDPGRSDVKVRGIAVGTVEAVRLRPDGRAAVALRVDDAIAVPATTRVLVEPVSVFGPKDLVLELGAGPALPDGGEIVRTADPREPADAARPAYDLARAIAPEDVAALLRALAGGLRGQGPALRRTVEDGARLVDAVHARRDEIERLILDLTGVSRTLGDRGGVLAGAAEDFDLLAPSLHDRPDHVSRLLDAAGELADRTSGTLVRHGDDLGRVIDGGAAAAAAVAPRARHLGMLLSALNRLFLGLGGIIRVPGPEGTLLAAGTGTLPLDLCAVFIDLC
ncbi:MCE family protein [Actinomadura fibrosa]|uniref:MCE family protein n=1 Tax=Actinomadura fibrosa TaxID=111802 RepID=A0ABW2XE68_9ACTN|nr:MCE family protein [Actinomadura fibrosa]